MTEGAFLFGIYYQWVGSITATGTASGYDPNAVDLFNQHEIWKTSSAGTLTVNCSPSSSLGAGSETRAIGIICPNGSGIIGNATVRLYNAAITLLKTIIVPRYSAEGLVDRRFIFIQNETWKNNVARIEIDVSAGSEISRVFRLGGPLGIGAGQIGGHCADLKDALSDQWTCRAETSTPIGRSSGSDFIWPINEYIIRYKVFQGVLSAFKENDQFSFRIFYDNRSTPFHEVVIFPYVFQNTDDPKKIKLMHLTSVFGRLNPVYQLQHVGIDLDGVTNIYNIPLGIEELI